MGIVNGGTAVGGILAPPLIAWILSDVHWLGVTPWRWVFFITGALGFAWLIWWWWDYVPPAQSTVDTTASAPAAAIPAESERRIPLAELLSYRQTWGIVIAKFLSDAAWYFYLFWLPKYLYDALGFDIKGVGTLAWIPYAAAGVGCLVGGALSSWLLDRALLGERARKIALGASAAMMPLRDASCRTLPVASVILLFCVGVLRAAVVVDAGDDPADRPVPQRRVGTVAGLVGLRRGVRRGGHGAARRVPARHGFGYGPVFAIAGSLHVAAFA